MHNHCHLLLKVENEDLEQIFKRIGARYVYWYNVKYKRVGHLFQDRYKSETVENDRQLGSQTVMMNISGVGTYLLTSAPVTISYGEQVEIVVYTDSSRVQLISRFFVVPSIINF